MDKIDKTKILKIVNNLNEPLMISLKKIEKFLRNVVFCRTRTQEIPKKITGSLDRLLFTLFDYIRTFAWKTRSNHELNLFDRKITRGGFLDSLDIAQIVLHNLYFFYSTYFFLHYLFKVENLYKKFWNE